MTINVLELEIFKQLFAAAADEMGTVLRMSSYSTNIKERRDFSCAVFNGQGKLVAQAAHIPVHLGAMPLSVVSILERYHDDLHPGDTYILNDPFQGGTHLPDITLVSPVFTPIIGTNHPTLFGFVASRAHHADIGGMTPGSMPLAREIFQEGLIIPPIRLVKQNSISNEIMDLILANVRTPEERAGDIWAQIAANKRGQDRVTNLITRYGTLKIKNAMIELISYSEKSTRSLLSSIPDGVYRYEDHLDDNGIDLFPVPIRVSIKIKGDEATVDFTGSAEQQSSGLNAVFAITLSAVAYVFRCLLDLDVPNNEGCMKPIRVIAPPGSIVNALSPAAVAGGNVETSQRIVDVLLGALAQACPEKIPAASQGTMNNLSIGGFYPVSTNHPASTKGARFTYYETIGGGTGALPSADGISAIHSHMTNTLNTPIEALEYAYPLRVRTYAIREGSGGAGRFRGGNGVIKEIELLTNCQITLLSDRRKIPPYGMKGGSPGACGVNTYLRNGQEYPLPSKGSIDLKAGDIICIHTPGGGGYGKFQSDTLDK